MTLFRYITLILSLGLATAAESGVSYFTACIDDRPWLPYTHPDLEKPGNMQILVFNASRELGVRVEVEPLPWKRCLDSVRQGKVDAAIGASAIPYIENFAVFPRNFATNEADSNRSLGSARVMLVKRRDFDFEWGVNRLSELQKPIGAPLGTFIITRALLERGGTVDNSAKTDDQNIRKLLQNRVDLMAGYEYDLKDLIQKSFKDKVSVMRKPLIESYYYLAFSKYFHRRNRDFVETFWNQIGKLQSKTSHEALNRDDLTALSKTAPR